jgi:hypothetical protein
MQSYLRDITLDLRPGPASRGPSLSCEEDDAQPHARCIFLNAFNNPLNIDFTRTFVTLRPVEAHAFGLRFPVSARRAEAISYDLSLRVLIWPRKCSSERQLGIIQLTTR